MCLTYRIAASILDSTNQQKHMVGCVYFFPTYIEGLEIETLLICVFILMSRAVSSWSGSQHSLLFCRKDF